ncbi:MAG: hypothetical protein HY717_08505 [Planctomycetes bacterium]|nr:hypothetical protein [Planctomycetota bacterium]
MAAQTKYLYAIMYPNHALVASMLPAGEFGKHYTLGSSRYFHGQVIFAEIDIDFRNPYFPIDQYLAELKPRPDGKPKRTKFIKSYRVLEHLDFSAFKNLYITSVVGSVLELKKEPYSKEHQPGFIRTFQNICPLSMLVLTYMKPPDYGKFITEPDQPKGAPKVMFCQIDLDIDKFLADLAEHPFLSSPLPNVHPHKLRDQILELRANPYKKVKGVSLDSVFGKISFLRLRTGFWIAHGDELLFYPIPDRATLEREHYEWYRSLTQ